MTVKGNYPLSERYISSTLKIESKLTFIHKYT